jgi:hypothetical protein
MLQDLTCEHFESLLNQVFRLNHDRGIMEAELVECKRLNVHSRGTSQREPFSLIFRGPRQPVLSQRIYNFDLGELGSFDIFIVPIGPDASGMRYQAIFG